MHELHFVPCVFAAAGSASQIQTNRKFVCCFFFSTVFFIASTIYTHIGGVSLCYKAHICGDKTETLKWRFFLASSLGILYYFQVHAKIVKIFFFLRNSFFCIFFLKLGETNSPPEMGIPVYQVFSPNLFELYITKCDHNCGVWHERYHCTCVTYCKIFLNFALWCCKGWSENMRNNQWKINEKDERRNHREKLETVSN